mmetsp:Transcript_29429/g.80464  ORF Transcript_29429/g.80464 Transcript_29429/m.80464 type:complete len:295 (+) Transcript_29429:266-1150(+)
MPNASSRLLIARFPRPYSIYSAKVSKTSTPDKATAVSKSATSKTPNIREPSNSNAYTCHSPQYSMHHAMQIARTFSEIFNKRMTCAGIAQRVSDHRLMRFTAHVSAKVATEAATLHNKSVFVCHWLMCVGATATSCGSIRPVIERRIVCMSRKPKHNEKTSFSTSSVCSIQRASSSSTKSSPMSATSSRIFSKVSDMIRSTAAAKTTSNSMVEHPCSNGGRSCKAENPNKAAKPVTCDKMPPTATRSIVKLFDLMKYNTTLTIKYKTKNKVKMTPTSPPKLGATRRTKMSLMKV